MAQQMARRNIQTSQVRQQRDYDLLLSESHYSEGDVVYKLESSTKVSAKALKSVWSGPWLVVKCQPPFYTVLRQRKKLV